MPVLFDWDDANLGHIAQHGVTRAEIEDALSGPTLDLGLQAWEEEERFSEIAITRSGRFLLVVTTFRGAFVRVITAYDAPRSLMRVYFRER